MNGKELFDALGLKTVCGEADSFDGVYAGATLTRAMRNSMVGATIIFFGIYYALLPVIGNDALWLAFLLYIIFRLVLQYFMADRLRDIYRQIEH